MSIEQMSNKLWKSLAYTCMGILLIFIFSFLPLNKNGGLFEFSLIILSLALVVFGFFLLVSGLVEKLRMRFEYMSGRMALIHVMAGLSFVLGLIMFFWFHGREIAEAKWYQYYFLVMPTSAYAMALLVMITHPIQALRDSESSEE
ncbi:hypothetical protein [Aurantivibrio infirmus]